MFMFAVCLDANKGFSLSLEVHCNKSSIQLAGKSIYMYSMYVYSMYVVSMYVYSMCLYVSSRHPMKVESVKLKKN